MLRVELTITLLAALAVNLPSGTLDADPGGALSHQSAPHSFDGFPVLPAVATGLAPLRLMSAEATDLPSTSSADWSPKSEPAELESVVQSDGIPTGRDVLRVGLLLITAILITILVLLANGILSLRREMESSYRGDRKASRPQAAA
jgi:hypothetical protein